MPDIPSKLPPQRPAPLAPRPTSAPGNLQTSGSPATSASKPAQSLSAGDTPATPQPSGRLLSDRSITVGKDTSAEEVTQLHTVLKGTLDALGSISKLKAGATAEEISQVNTQAKAAFANAKVAFKAVAEQAESALGQGTPALGNFKTNKENMFDALNTLEGILNGSTAFSPTAAKEHLESFATNFNSVLTQAESLEDKSPSLGARIGQFILGAVSALGAGVAAVAGYTFAVSGGTLLPAGLIAAGSALVSLVAGFGAAKLGSAPKSEFVALREALGNLQAAVKDMGTERTGPTPPGRPSTPPPSRDVPLNPAQEVASAAAAQVRQRQLAPVTTALENLNKNWRLVLGTELKPVQGTLENWASSGTFVQDLQNLKTAINNLEKELPEQTYAQAIRLIDNLLGKDGSRPTNVIKSQIIIQSNPNTEMISAARNEVQAFETDMQNLIEQLPNALEESLQRPD